MARISFVLFTRCITFERSALQHIPLLMRHKYDLNIPRFCAVVVFDFVCLAFFTHGFGFGVSVVGCLFVVNTFFFVFFVFNFYTNYDMCVVRAESVHFIFAICVSTTFFILSVQFTLYIYSFECRCRRRRRGCVGCAHTQPIRRPSTPHVSHTTQNTKHICDNYYSCSGVLHVVACASVLWSLMLCTL